MIINCIVNAEGTTLIRFYTFRRDYIQLYKLGTCKAIQSKAWMTTFIFKEFLSFLKTSIPSGNPNKYASIQLRWAWIPCLF